MKFKRGDIVYCKAFGDDYYKIEATKEEPNERTVPYPMLVSPDEGYDYVIHKFQYFQEDGSGWFSGPQSVHENRLTDAASDYIESRDNFLKDDQGSE